MLQRRNMAIAPSPLSYHLTKAFSWQFLSSASSTKTIPAITFSYIQVRHASHSTQGRANTAAQGPGKRLGAKRAASELVVPGCILFRQRGAKWWPGENCTMGRDHTISAIAKGYVRYYRDPERHPKRKFIGVVFEEHETLPRPEGMARKRRLGMEPRIMKVEEQEEVTVDPKMAFTSGYQYRPSNAEIGRAAKESGRTYPKYKPHDRWLAWRLRNARHKAAAERKALRMRTSSQKKKKQKQRPQKPEAQLLPA